MSGVPRGAVAITVASVTLLCADALTGQIRPAYSYGAAGLLQLLERLQTTASALHVGAHPDDEDSHFIARVARGDNARVAYLSLTRGEGGQNILGSELFEALGVIRTEELLQARRLDGGEQFFTRAIDYGFSKTRAEAAAKWDERIVLADMVRVIRRFRPLVVYSRFSGTTADGHGQHQFAGYLTPIAFKAAADPGQFPEQLKEGLRPWQAKKLYRSVGFRPDPASPPTLRLPTGVFDPLLGRYYTEIGNEGRSQHKSQGMGVIETKGPRDTGLIRLDASIASEQGLFEGLDTSIAGISRLAGINSAEFGTGLRQLQTTVERTLQMFKPREPAASVAGLQRAVREVRALRAMLKTVGEPDASTAEADFLLDLKETDLGEALVRAAGVLVDPLADRETVVPGGSVAVAVNCFFEGQPVKVLDASLEVREGWTVERMPAESDGAVGGRFFRDSPSHVARFRATAPADAEPTQPYYLDDPRDADRYRWDESDPKGAPFATPALTARVTFDIAGVPVSVSEAVLYRLADAIRGEVRRNVEVVPRVAVDLDARLLIVPTGTGPSEQRLGVRATNLSTESVSGTLRLALPDGWKASPAAVPFSMTAEGERTSASFTVVAPAGRSRGALQIGVEASVGGTTHAIALQEIAYPHIQTRRIYSPARAVAQVFDLAIVPVAVGYVMGSGDQVPEMIRRMGVPVTMLDDDTLTGGDLSRFDTIVVGIRASEARPAFVTNHRRLLEYAERGGTLIVQYQQNDYVARQLPPYPAEMSSRVVDETAPVGVLAPDHPVFTFPNRIRREDFDDWVHERNLYAFTTFDPRYTPLLETADAGEAPQRGGQVYARLGRGHYIYTAYAWFRQLPAGVPGAYRQFANLISLAKAP